MEASSNRFHKWESNFIKTIESKRVINREDELGFKDFIRNIESINRLPPPYEDLTNYFLNIFSPQIINTILDIRSLSIEAEMSYETILRQYSQILGQQLTNNKNINDDTNIDDSNSNEKFIQAASKIIESKNSNFYQISEKSKAISGKNSENYDSNCHIFATTANLELFTDFFQCPTMKSLSKIEHIIKILLPISQLFDIEKMNTFIQISTSKIWELISSQNPRNLKISEIETALTSLEKMTTNKSVKNVVWKVQISFSIKILKSGILTNQLSSLNTICRICKESPKMISPILRDENLIDYLLNPDKNANKDNKSKTDKDENESIENNQNQTNKNDESQTIENNQNQTDKNNQNDQSETNKNDQSETNKNDQSETNKNDQSETNKNDESQTIENNQNQTDKNNQNDQSETNKNDQNQTDKNNQNDQSETNKNDQSETNKNDENQTIENNQSQTDKNNQNDQSETNKNEVIETIENNQSQIDKNNQNDQSETNKNDQSETNINEAIETIENNQSQIDKNNESETNKNDQSETNINEAIETIENNQSQIDKNNESETNKNDQIETIKNNEYETDKKDENETIENNQNETDKNNENKTIQINQNETDKNDDIENASNSNLESISTNSLKRPNLKRNQSFIGDDIHFELINNIADIFSSMYICKCATDIQLKTLWLKSITQSQTTIGTFLKSMGNVLSQIPKEPFFNMIIETNRFPESIFPFLQSISSQCPPHCKAELFNKLHELYFSGKNFSEDSENVLIQTMLDYILDSDPTFCNKLQIECINFIKSDTHIKYSLKILQNALFFMTSMKAHEAFEIIMNKVEKDSIEFLDLIVEIMKKFDSQVNKDDFIVLQEKVTKMIPDHSLNVCEFYSKLIDTSNSQRSVLSNDSILNVFNNFCSLSFNENVFEMIKKLYRILVDLHLNSESNEKVEIVDSIWKHLFETNRKEVSSFLISIYVNSDDHNKAKKFIENCSKDLHCVGSLEAIRSIIHVMEDGTEFREKCQQNRILFSFDLLTVNLNYLKNKPRQIKVTKDISYEGFKRTVIKNIITEQQKEINVHLYNDSVLLNHNNFNLVDNANITVSIDDNCTDDTIKITVDKEDVFPSQVLLQEKFFAPIFDILLENDQKLSPISLDIFNLIPTLPTQVTEINSILSSSNKEEAIKNFLSVQHPYLFTYRMHIMGNIELKDKNSDDENADFQSIKCHDFLNCFYNSGGIECLLNIIFKIDSSSSLPNNRCINDLLRITKLLLLDLNFSEIVNTSIEKVKDGIESLLNWTKNIADSNNDGLLADITLFMKELTDYLVDFDGFSEIVNKTIVHKLPEIRSNSYEIINSIDSISTKEKLIIPLLKNLAKTSKCAEYFNLLTNIARLTKNPFNLFEATIDALYENFTMPVNVPPLKKLMFVQPPANYAYGLFKTLNILIERLYNENNKLNDEDSEKLFKFLTNEIIFNPYKYYQPSEDLFSAYLILLDNNEQFLSLLDPIVKIVEDFKLTPKMSTFLSATARNRGIKNLGATCYMNSTIQQLFNIKEFTTKILSSTSENDWFSELQYDFAKLWLFPSNSINISNFVQCWKGYDEEPTNIHQQQDSAEFLQLLIDRLEQKIPGITSIFTGKIEHCTVGAKVQYEKKNYETFDIFPLEVENHMKTSESFHTFLRPDRFECNDEELGKFDALRYHYIIEAPKILILQLKRFNYNLTTMEREKINSFYTFKLELDLSPIMKTNQKILYDLCGVVQHQGSANSGHYFSDVKRETGKWLCLNDTKCTKVNGDDLPLDAAGGKEEKTVFNEKTKKNQIVKVDKTTNAYLLFYRLREEKVENNDQIVLNENTMNRLLPAIQKAIFEAVCSAPQFSKLVLKICKNGKNNEFLYKYALNSMRITKDQQMTETLVSKCIEICKINQEFCDFILNRETDFYEFIILMKFSIIRKYFVSIIEASLKNCSIETRNKFYNYLFNQISSSGQIIYENKACIPEFFKIVILTIDCLNDINKKELLIAILDFVIDSSQLYDSKHKSEKIFYSINLSNTFELMTKLSKEIETDELKLTISTKMFKSPIFTSLTVSQNHNKNLATFLEFLLLSNIKTKKIFHSYLDKKIKTIPIPTIALFLNLSMTISDQELIDRFFDIIQTKSYQEIVLFFYSLEPICHSNRNIFMFNAQIWIKYFLLSSNISVRASLVIFIYKMFPDVINNKNESEAAKGIIVNIYQNLIDSVPLLIEKITKLKKSSQNIPLNDDNIPTQEFFEILTWSVETVQMKDQKDIQIFVSFLQTLDELLRNVPNVNASFSQLNCLQYLVKLYGKKLFTLTQPINVITPLNNSCKSNNGNQQRSEEVFSMINNLLINVLPKFCTCYLKSKLFSLLLMDSFNLEASNFVKENLNKETVRLITTVLWNQNVLKKNCLLSNNNNLLYLQTSWKIIKDYIDTCDIIYEQQDYVVLLNLINKNSPIQRTAAKFLAEFNFAYETVNRNKKFFLTLKTQNLYRKYKENGFKWNLIYEAMYNNRNMISPGNGGLCQFSRSMIALKKNPPQTLLSLISRSKKPFVTTVLPTVHAARLICDLCEAFPDSGEAINCLIREFSAINTCYKVVEIFCMAFAKMKRKNFWLDLQKPLQEIFLKSDDIDVAGQTVLRMSEQLFDKDVLRKFRNKVVELMAAEIRKIINELADSGLKIIHNEYERLNNAYEFVHDISSTIGDKEPQLDISKEESQKLIEIFKSNKIVKTFDSFFLYISKK